MKAIHFICLGIALTALLAACGGGGGGGKIQPIPPGDNQNQQTPPPSTFWGDPFIGEWHIHGSGSEVWVGGTRVPNPWPRLASVNIQREGDALKATLESGLGSFVGWSALVLSDYEWLVDVEQLNPGGPSGVSYIEVTSQENASYGNVDWPILTMHWYDSDVLVGDWINSYYYQISLMHPRRWNEVLSLALVPLNPDDPLYNGYYRETYLGY